MKYVLLFVMIFLLGCDSGSDEIETQQLWYKDELLTQLGEIKKELKALNKKLDSFEAKRPGKKQRDVSSSKSISIGSSPVLGSKAKVAIVEFADFQCGYCAHHHNTVFPLLKEQYIDKGKIMYVAKDFPLSFHREAAFAASAAHCAGEQNNYWEMRDAIFTNKKYSKDFFIESINSLGIEAKKFEACLDSGKYKDHINSDIAFGHQFGVTGTPRFFIGTVVGDEIRDIKSLSGAQPFAVFEQVIKQLSRN